LLTAGVPADLLRPKHWDTLFGGLGEGISALPGLSVPYRGVDEWNRIAMLLGGTVLAVLGPKWTETAAFVPILACAMPLMTLQILFGPALNALGRPQVTMHTSLAGALIMPPTIGAAIRFMTSDPAP
ncbi:MAG: hypothetical protein ACLGIW_22225, partial [Gammaproteobacteria bacterium]